MLYNSLDHALNCLVLSRTIFGEYILTIFVSRFWVLFLFGFTLSDGFHYIQSDIQPCTHRFGGWTPLRSKEGKEAFFL
jgi:hypothetical protein